MILQETLSAIGLITKTHGTSGELNAVLDIPADYLYEAEYVIMEMDGIPVPFKLQSVRMRGTAGALLLLEDVDSEPEAKLFTGKTIYTDKERLHGYMVRHKETDDGDFADDLIGYSIISGSGALIGIIADLELSTENALFVAEDSEGQEIYIPIADEFISEIDHENRTLTMNLPDGLAELNQ